MSVKGDRLDRHATRDATHALHVSHSVCRDDSVLGLRRQDLQATRLVLLHCCSCLRSSKREEGERQVETEVRRPSTPVASHVVEVDIHDEEAGLSPDAHLDPRSWRQRHAAGIRDRSQEGRLLTIGTATAVPREPVACLSPAVRQFVAVVRHLWLQRILVAWLATPVQP